jgi:2-C-methyl-D-erythritol 4-phosphate cytidylyltransferase
MRVAAVVFAPDPPDGPVPLTLLGGRPMLDWAISALRAGAEIAQLVVAGADTALDGVIVVSGQDSRHAALHEALSLLDSRVEIVLLHDAHRPLASAELVSRVVGAVLAGAPAAVPAIEVTETVKELDTAARVTRTIPRDTLRRVQAPRAVRRSVLEAAHAGCDPGHAGGEPALVPAGTLVATVPGETDAFPVLRPADLILAEAVAALRPGPR